MTIRGLTPKEVRESGLEGSVVWYVVNVSKGHVSGFPEKTVDVSSFNLPYTDPYERITPVFLSKEDAETCRSIVSRGAFLQNDVLMVENESYSDIEARIKDHPEFKLQLFDAERAKKLFSNPTD